MEIVGRARELALLETLLRAAGRGRGGAVDVTGEPGVGKTRLLAELAARAAQDGWLVLTGRGTEFEAGVPFGIVADALDEHVGALGPERARRLSGNRLGELAALLPSLAGTAAAPSLDGERHHLHYAARAVLAGLADARPLLLVLDDVHWADAASLELIAHLVRRPPHHTLLALAYRPAQAPRALARMGARERVALSPLSRDDAEPLLAAAPRAHRDTLYEQSGGNPLFLEALLNGVRPVEVRRSTSSTRSRRPPSRSRAEPPWRRSRSRQSSPRPPPSWTSRRRWRARRAARRGPGERDGLTAPLPVPPPDRAPGDLRVGGRGLAARRARARRGRAGAPGRGRRAARAPPRAVRAARRPRRPSTCSRPPPPRRRRARRPPRRTGGPRRCGLLPAAATRDERLALLVPRATALGAAGELAESRDALREVLALVPAEQVALRGHIVAFVALIEQLLGRQEEAHALLVEALAEQPYPVSQPATALRIELAKERYFVADWRGMRRYAADALVTARTLEDPPLIAAADRHPGARRVPPAGRRGGPRAARPGRGAARRPHRRAARRAASTPRWFVGWSEQCLARWDDVHRHYERALAVARATGQGYLLVPMTIGRAIAYAWQGDLAAAAELAEEAIEAARLSGNAQSLTWALTLRCWIATLAGDLDLAIATGEEALATAGRLARTHWGALTACYLAEAKLEAGDPEGCRDLLTPQLPLVERAFQTRWYEILTRAELAMGRFPAAQRHADCADATSRGLGPPGPDERGPTRPCRGPARGR